MPARWTRVVRGGATAVASVLLAALSHVAGGAGSPGVLGVVLALVLATPLCVALGGRRLALGRLVASVLLSQVALHALFGLGTTAGGVTSSSPAGAHHHAPFVLRAVPGGEVVPVLDGAAAGPWVAHLVAAVLTVLALRRGEQALGRLVDLAGGLVRVVALLTWRPPVTGVRLLPVVAPARRPVAARFLVALPRRGPPLPA